MSETFDATGPEERNRGADTREEFRAEMQRMRDELTDKANAFIKILGSYAQPAKYNASPATNGSKPPTATGVADF